MNDPLTMLVVLDLESTRRFYVDVLGLAVKSQRPDRIHFMVGNHEIVMFRGTGPAAKTQHGKDAGSTLIFSTDDIDEKMRKMKSLGVKFLHPTPQHNDMGRYAAFVDPSGIVHEIFEAETRLEGSESNV